MPIGRNKIYLPNFTIGLLRSKHLPPKYAQFLVPLNFTKLDIKDFLLHGYGVKTLSVRSYVVQQKVQRIKNLNEPRKEAYRPRAIKRMTVELEKPFVYPAEPEDLTPWDNALWKSANKERQETGGVAGDKKKKKENRSQLMEMAKEKFGLKSTEQLEEVEVDQDQKIR
ncbi:hypothetical protein DFH27DRAFT_576190 [Peziza echinospora]|nr:hypothetical protein DFH27DRAFT_576190 [Peziza echinospora]